MRKASCVSCAIAVFVGAIVAAPTAALAACEQITEMAQCDNVPPPDPNTECVWAGYSRYGPYYEWFVINSTTITQGSGWTLQAKKCQRGYIMQPMGGGAIVWCFGPQYGTPKVFTNNYIQDCSSGGSGGGGGT